MIGLRIYEHGWLHKRSTEIPICNLPINSLVQSSDVCRKTLKFADVLIPKRNVWRLRRGRPSPVNHRFDHRLIITWRYSSITSPTLIFTGGWKVPNLVSVTGPNLPLRRRGFEREQDIWNLKGSCFCTYSIVFAGHSIRSWSHCFQSSSCLASCWSLSPVAWTTVTQHCMASSTIYQRLQSVQNATDHETRREHNIITPVLIENALAVRPTPSRIQACHIYV